MMPLTGYDFNKMYKTNKFYKYLDNNTSDHNIQYVLGLNVDVRPIYPSNSLPLPNGLHFYEESQCYLYRNEYEDRCKLATIVIPHNATVYVEKNRFRTDRLIITHIEDIDAESESSDDCVDDAYYPYIIQRWVNAFTHIDIDYNAPEYV